MNIGYARVSTEEQTLDLQLDALAKAECGKVFQETAGGALVERASFSARDDRMGGRMTGWVGE
jgi:DNA invertase Pin-like site-specific DNA recombinase